MMNDIKIVCSDRALDEFSAYCANRGYKRFFMVCDQTTFRVLGSRIQQILEAQQADVKVICLDGKEVIADERYLMQVALEAGDEERVYLSVGSGTITDITRFIAHRCRLPFISFPTAPSVDGYTSVGAPLVFRLYKQTVPCKAPEAVFADLPTLCQSPRPMIAAGFGDMLGKYSALTDWKIGSLVFDPNYHYDAAVAQRSANALQSCMQNLDEISKASPEGIYTLFMGLIETGLCILQVGHACPAAGAEHHTSHFLEMRLLLEGRPAIFHGAKVGFGTILESKRYQILKKLSVEDVKKRLEQGNAFSAAAEIKHIESVFGPITGMVLKQQKPFLEQLESNAPLIRQNIITHWPEIVEILNTLPSPEELTAWLGKVGGPTRAADITFDDATVELAMDNSHYLRDRVSAVKLGHLLSVW